MQDPRFKNESIPGDSASSYFQNYVAKLSSSAKSVSGAALDKAFLVLEQALQQGSRIYVAGNGGSAAIADHLCCDWMKGTHVPGQPALQVHSMAASTALITALANDFSYEETFSKQVEMVGQAGDVLILISSSGNSKNIVHAIETAKSKKMTVIGLSGFSGGRLNELADVSIHVAANNYGIVEDTHQMVMHTLAQYLAKLRDSKK